MDILDVRYIYTGWLKEWRRKYRASVWILLRILRNRFVIAGQTAAPGPVCTSVSFLQVPIDLFQANT